MSAEQTAASEFQALVDKLTTEQKIRLLSGGGSFSSAAEPGIGLGAMSFSDGPAGVRGERWDERDTALLLPSPTAVAAAWDEDLAATLGLLLAAEARRKRVHVILAPTLNLHRSPLGGRHFECLSEDPQLTARIGAAVISGIQAGGVAATAKHYVANESETDRLTVDTGVDERTLREVYLPPFDAAVQAGAWLVMAAYNSVAGSRMSESPLLDDPLKREWGFDGVVVSDWGAVRSTEPAASAALDLAMPGPHPPWSQALLDAVRQDRVDESVLEDKIRRILLLAARVGALAGHGAAPRPPSARPAEGEGRALLRRAVAAGAVLLRNEEELLPLDPGRLNRLAVLGPGAATPYVQGGGSVGVFPAAVVSPLEGIRDVLAGRAELLHTPGAFPDSRPTPLHPGIARNPVTHQPGVLVRYLGPGEREVHSEHRLSGRILEPADAVLDPAEVAAVEVSAILRPETSGRWHLAVTGLGRLRLLAGERILIDEFVAPDSDDPTYLHVNPPFRRAALDLEAGTEVLLCVRREPVPGSGWVAALAADPPRRDEDAELAAAEELARAADAAVVVVGTGDGAESEGADRTSLALPGRQDELVTRVAAANPRTVVIVNAGAPVELPWREETAATLLGWFPGQEAGHGLADVLFGAVEPGGRLPTTWPARAGDAPVLSTVPVDGRLDYTEGLHVGYRGWLRAGLTPAYWFGHGLGYTTWSYEEIRVTPPAAPGGGAPTTVTVTVRNTGGRRGREVVQVYLSAPVSGTVDRPVRWLAGWAAVTAAPGETVRAGVELGARAFQYWCTRTHAWRTEPTGFTAHAGPSAGVLPLSHPVQTAG